MAVCQRHLLGSMGISAIKSDFDRVQSNFDLELKICNQCNKWDQCGALGAIITPSDIFNLIPLYSSTIEDIQVEVLLLCLLVAIVSI